MNPRKNEEGEEKGMKFRFMTWKTWKREAKWKKPDTEGQILHDSIYMKSPEQANP